MSISFNQFLINKNLELKEVIEHSNTNFVEFVFEAKEEVPNLKEEVSAFFPFIKSLEIIQNVETPKEINEPDSSEPIIEESGFSLDDWTQNQIHIQQEEQKKYVPVEKEKGTVILKPNMMLIGKKIEVDPISIDEIDFTSDVPEKNICVEGDVFKLDIKDNEKSKIFSIYLTDYTSSIIAQLFVSKSKKDLLDKVENNLKQGLRLKIFGNVEYNDYQKDKLLTAKAIQLLEPNKREDKAEEKRIELHCHTQYSTLEGVSKVKDLLNRIKEYGHDTLGITDSGVLQAFPELQSISEREGLKILYGLEANIVDTEKKIITGKSKDTIDDDFIFFDLETTGTSIYKDKIIEIAAVLVKNGEIRDTYQTFVNPHQPLPPKITELTGITNEMVNGGIEEDEAVEGLLDFIGDTIIVAHNAEFDTGFLRRWFKEKNREFNYPYIDTLPLARAVVPEIGRYNMGRLCSFFKIKNDHAHRAIDDSIASAKVLLKLYERVKEKGITNLNDLNSLIDIQTMAKKNSHTTHATIFPKNQDGLKKLYQLVSDSHLKYFQGYPRIPKEILNENRENLLIGSADSKSELYEAIIDNTPYTNLLAIASFYDFLEVQPVENHMYLNRRNPQINKEKLREFNKIIIKLGEDLKIPVVATSDARFLDPHDVVIRDIVKSATNKKSSYNREPFYLRTTEEMLEEFSYLHKDKTREIVLDNPRKIANLIEKVKPVPDGTFPPVIEGAEEEIKELCLTKAHKVYGPTLPEFVQKRMNRELNSIISNGYAVLYLIAHKLVKHSEEDGFLVGSRGSVGSSLVAFLSDITEVNALPAHYLCPDCYYTEVIEDPSVVGPDLEDKKCPHCGSDLTKNGFNIPFETFLGFEGDKEPDIDLNFSGDNQAEAHRYTEELFGEGHTFRAGTISTIQEATAFGFVKNYFENQGKSVPKAEIERLKIGCTGIKRTTGQHPGGIMVVPRDREIYEFTPIQFPADDQNSPTITTHFDYHSISGRLLKLDILGHDDPTMLRNLELLTGVNPKSIPLDDREVISLFTGVDALKFKEKCSLKLGNSGIPEFGTPFVRQMILELKPKTFIDLLRISGWSHGTDVWNGNVQKLLKDEVVTKDKVVSTRDDIMSFLLKKGLEPIDSFTIMEHVRKGKLLTEDEKAKMREKNVEEWFIESCDKISYLFPKAHAVAYVVMAYRIAWYKIHYPLAYYACFFGVRAKEFDLKTISSGMDAINAEINRIKDMSRFEGISNKDSQSLVSLELALEMYARGYKCLGVDLKKSHYNKFLIEDGALRPPLSSVNGMGELAAESLYRVVREENILSQEELLAKSKVTKTNLQTLEELGCLGNIPKSNQVSFF